MTQLAPSEGLYRVVDAIYRLHDQTYNLEFAVERSMRLGLTLTRLRTNTAMGAMVAGMLALVPILTALANITLTSTPALAVYLLVVGLVVLWAYQIYDARRTHRQLDDLSSVDSTTPYERQDYLLERINAWVVRARVLDHVIHELSVASSDPTATVVDQHASSLRLKRYEEIREACHREVQRIVTVSKERYEAASEEKKAQAGEQHAKILDWAAGLLKS